VSHRLLRQHVLGELAQCDRHIAQSRANIAHQEQMIAWREISGRDPALSRALLGTFSSVLQSHEHHRDILLRELVIGGQPRVLFGEPNEKVAAFKNLAARLRDKVDRARA
jgi:hypothetical protein